ncbi:DUF2075 domain-containing protein [Salinicoccus sp. ID82-1]|uniref:DUF2075 domain-containing protein n=1 Tax=Salinicoccus sp. ID82-1 TaxID=2820269 RepID=UPI001F2A2428|nr:DUF2075 domain-containing protein [Salinicoccus sp. ID82-1]MCG1009708.1 DUF2075 domain-containing protein [Salinicoccus sp. ID82-1]
MTDLQLKALDFNEIGIRTLTGMNYNNFPIVYILHNNKKKQSAYIGQTVQMRNRMKAHLKDKNKQGLDKVLLVSHEMFNQSATYNIETNLINYFIADNKYTLRNVSQTTKSMTHNYYEKYKYDNEIFSELWEKLRADKLVDNTLEYLQNKDVFKLSPYKELSESQVELKEEILEFCKTHIQTGERSIFLVKGDAGTGKSVVLSSTFNAVQDLSKDEESALKGTNNYLLVNHNEMIKTYESISESLPNLKKKNFMKPTSFINQMDKTREIADITFVDEAHLLLSRSDKYNSYTGDNQLRDISLRSKVTVVVFDEKQFLKLKSHWSSDLLEGMTKGAKVERFELTDQFRIQADQEVVDWIDSFVDKKVKRFPEKTGDYELKLFDSAAEMFKAIEDKDRKHQLSRVVATFDYEHKKDGAEYYVQEPGFKGIWNRTEYKETWAEHPETIKEVGSIYTIQGFDLNYVGVILGPSVSYDEEKQELKLLPQKYKDKEAFRTSSEVQVEYNVKEMKEQIILNSINVLMKRGVKGLYLYASDDKLKKVLAEKYKEGEQDG